MNRKLASGLLLISFIILPTTIDPGGPIENYTGTGPNWNIIALPIIAAVITIIAVIIANHVSTHRRKQKTTTN